MAENLRQKRSFIRIGGLPCLLAAACAQTAYAGFLPADSCPRFLAPAIAVVGIVSGILIWQIGRIREQRKSADRANAAKSQFLANMSHEIRTPLNGIVGMVELISRSRLDSEQREMIRILQESCESLTRMVNAILDLSRIESGGLVLEEEDFDLYESIEAAVRLMMPLAAAKNLQVRTQIAPAVPRYVRGYPSSLRQVALNLLSNAIKFTDSGSITFKAAPAGDPKEQLAVLFSIVDSGIGIPAKTLSKLFQPFSQGDETSTRKYGGAGLGLAISKRLVSLMGGKIGVETQTPGGSTFWFLLPLTAASEPARAESADSALPGDVPPEPDGCTSGRILIVEDNPVNQIVAVRAVRNLGYCAEVVDGGEKALDALVRSRFNLILMDCQMPGMDGYTTAAEIRRREARSGLHIRIPIVAMTANAVEGDHERCLAVGMDDYLPKPLRMSVLQKTIETWIAKTHPSKIA